MPQMNQGALRLVVIVLIGVVGCTATSDRDQVTGPLPETTDPTPATVETGPLVAPAPEPTTISTPELTPTPSPKLPPLPEPTEPVVAVPLSQEPNPTNPSDPLAAVPLAGETTAAFLDVRGVGDAAMAETHTQPFKITDNLPEGVPANFGLRLDAFDPEGKSYRGDLSFINWESTVGTRCNRFWAPQGPASFAFMSDPQNLVELHKRQFNLIGLANNHTRDCPDAEGGVDGAHASALHMTRLSQELGANWLWHGVGTDKVAAVNTLMLKGKPVKVAFASLYIAGGDCTYVTCETDTLTVLRSLRDADADLRILAMHSWTDETQAQLVDIGVNFLRNFDGDIVFGHGPHIWKPVRVVESARGDGKRGVMFESLGNFIHPALVPGSQHLIGRALFDLETLKLRQVQVIPIAVSRINVSFGGSAAGLPANLTWQETRDPAWQSGVSPNISAAYANIKQ